MKFTMIVCLVFLTHARAALAQGVGHDAGHTMGAASSPLTEAGNDAFGTIQEVIRHLNADSTTDWSRVDLEALRRHLVDMQDMTINVEVLSQEPIDNGVQIVLRPATLRAEPALDRVFAAHPAQLRREAGWEMLVLKEGQRYTLTVTTPNRAEVEKIRGLGYIGIMAWGSHHQRHHWMLATGRNPHGG